jgi:CNP1-like family
MIKNRFVCLALISLCINAQAQFIADDADWKESDVPPAPAFDLKRLISIEVSAQSQLQWGIDSETIKITNADSVVRYVIVARSASGVVNAMYEGLHCKRGEVITYARHNKDSGWVNVSRPEWRSFRTAGVSRHSQMAAKQGLCDGSAPALTPREAIRMLRNPASNN